MNSNEMNSDESDRELNEMVEDGFPAVEPKEIPMSKVPPAAAAVAEASAVSLRMTGSFRPTLLRWRSLGDMPETAFTTPMDACLTALALDGLLSTKHGSFAAAAVAFLNNRGVLVVAYDDGRAKYTIGCQTTRRQDGSIEAGQLEAHVAASPKLLNVSGN